MTSVDMGGRRGRAGMRLQSSQLAADLGVVLADAPARVGQLPRIIYGHSLGGAVVLIHAVRGRDVHDRDATAPRIVTGPPSGPRSCRPRGR